MNEGRKPNRSDARGPDEIEQDLEETREKLAEDLDALSLRLSPQHLTSQALGSVDAAHEAATEQVEKLASGVTDRAAAVADRVVGGVRSSRMPLPLVLYALGAGYVLMEAGREREGREVPSRSASTGSGGMQEPSRSARGYVYAGDEPSLDENGADSSFLSRNGLLVGLGALAAGAVAGTILSIDPTTAQRGRKGLHRARRRIQETAAGFLDRFSGSGAGAIGAGATGTGIQVRERVRVNRSADELYRFWRDLENLPRVMSHLEKVTVEDRNRSHWAAKGPAGQKVEWDAVITDDRPNDAIAWRSLPGSQIPNEGAVKFLRAGPNATDVIVSLTVHPPGGKLGGLVAKLFGEEPSQQVGDDLERFKEEVESGRLVLTSSTTAAGTALAGPAVTDRG